MEKGIEIFLQICTGTHSMDFVQYMVQVGVNSALDDTQRFAEMQKIMNSIALIADTSKQQLFIQELSGILGMREDVVARSVSAARRHYVEEKRRAQNAEQLRQTDTANPTDAVHSAPELSSALQAEIKRQATGTYEKKIEQNFQGVAQMIVEHGNEVYSDNGDGTYLPVGLFLIYGLREDNIKPQNPMVAKVLSEYEQHFADPGFKTVQWFTLHSDQELASFVASILTGETSENYAKDAYELLNALKFNICDMRLRTEKNMDPATRQALLSARASFDRKRKK